MNIIGRGECHYRFGQVQLVTEGAFKCRNIRLPYNYIVFAPSSNPRYEQQRISIRHAADKGHLVSLEATESNMGKI
jgi:hypothetical protein